MLLSCLQDDASADTSQYMQLSILRSENNNESNKPCFIFWKQTDYLDAAFPANPSTPYVYRHPEGVIDDYKVPKYNTQYVYPPYSEWVHAVGVSPGNLISTSNTNWKEFDIPETKAGLIDIQCAPDVRGSQQSPFSDPLVFAHQLTKLEIQGYCGSSMKDGDKHVNVKEISVSISSDSASQWKLFPQKLEWDHGSGNDGQYKVIAYTSKPSSEIVAEILAKDTILYGNIDTSKENAKLIGNFYFVPGFNTITLKIEATYEDFTTDGKTEINRIWNTVTISGIHPEIGNTVTSAGESYPVKLMFDRSQIILGAELEGWGPGEIHN